MTSTSGGMRRSDPKPKFQDVIRDTRHPHRGGANGTSYQIMLLRVRNPLRKRMWVRSHTRDRQSLFLQQGFSIMVLFSPVALRPQSAQADHRILLTYYLLARFLPMNMRPAPMPAQQFPVAARQAHFDAAQPVQNRPWSAGEHLKQHFALSRRICRES